MVVVEAHSEVGLRRVDFLVDDKIEQQHVSVAPEENTLQTVFPWFSSNTGWHQLSVIAYDLQGRPSDPAWVQVGVQASLGFDEVIMVDDAADAGEAPEAEEQDPQDGIPGNQPEGGADEPLEGEPAPEDAAPPNAEEEIPLVDEPVLPEADQPPLELPPQPQDASPVISNFDVFVDVVANPEGNFVGLSAVAIGAANDDLGLERLTISWQSDAGHEGDFSTQCAGDLACEIELADILLEGRWVFSLQAFDTSGQASQPEIEIVEILGDPVLPPAAAEHEIDEDWLREHLAGAQRDFDLRIPNMPFVPGFDVDEFFDGMFGGRGDPDEPEEEAEVQVEGQCATISVDPRADGNTVTLQVECELEIDGEGRFLLPYVGKYLMNTGDGGISLFIPDWKDDTRISIAAGDTFTWLDWDVTCGTDYRYSVRVDSAVETDIGLATGRNFAFAQAETTTPECSPGSIGDVNLRADAHPEGALIRWDIVGDGDWPEDLPDNGVAFVLTRFDLVSEQAVQLYQENIPTDLLLAGGEFEVLDDSVQCGTETMYSLAAIAADADLGLVSPGWLLRSQVRGPEMPCPAGDLGSIELRLTPYWFNESNVRVRIQTQIPSEFNWPPGDNVHLEVLRIRQGIDQCEGPPCRGIWQAKERIPITDEIRLNGLSFEDDDTSVNFGRETYVYRLVLFVEGEEVQSGPNFSATMPLAPPPPPDIVRLTATNNCANGAPRCVVIEWQAYEQPRQNGYYAEAANIVVERVIFGTDRQAFPVGMADTLFVDLNPYMDEFQLANGEVRQVCRYDVLYRMVALDAEGHRFGASGLSVITPQCNEPWNEIVEAR